MYTTTITLKALASYEHTEVDIQEHATRVMALEEFRHQINEFEMVLETDEAPEEFRIEVRAATGFLVAAMQHHDRGTGIQLEDG